jgi:excisionase family DNA binding protein
MKKFLTVGQFAEEFGIGHTTALRWITEGKVKTVKTVGGHNRVPLQEVKRLKKELGFDDEGGQS